MASSLALRPELLAPAGDFEKLCTALRYGADAVYFGGEAFSLRGGGAKLTLEEMREGLDLLHKHGAKGYLTLNSYPRSADMETLARYIRQLKTLPIDAYIVSDVGVMSLLREIHPEAELHISTQANTTNARAARFWSERMGAKRIVAARELSFSELRALRAALPEQVEIEAFVHGAMCISYSGRCLLSSFMTGRDANRGVCSHPCRWAYALAEAKRPGEYYPIEEDACGSYILNSRDLCMIDALPQLIRSGVHALKIEGRMKSAYYVATVVSAYRAALDTYLADPDGYVFDERWRTELCKASHRPFSHGFYEGDPGADAQGYESSDYLRSYQFTGVVLAEDPESGYTLVEQRNKFSRGDRVEIFGPHRPYREEVIGEILDEQGQPITSAPHPKQRVKLKLEGHYPPGCMLRRRDIP